MRTFLLWIDFRGYIGTNIVPHERIGQVLISNAIKYSLNADRVVVASTQDTNKVIISVQDFGVGIPKEEHAKVFDRFFRVKAKREKVVSRLVLGLYITFEIIFQHKGKLWVESTEGKGSTFSFSLPVK
jgi:signal transduction histidine kinase